MIFIYLTDSDSSRYMLPNDLPISFQLNNCNSILELLSTIEIVKTLGNRHCLFDDIDGKLNFPKLIFQIIKAEEEYQIELYFSKVFEPHIDYTYPNEY